MISNFNHFDIWKKYQEMCLKNPIKLNTVYGPFKNSVLKSNIRVLESHLDGDWYYLLQDLFGPFIKKIKPGRTRFKSNLNNKEIEEIYISLGHIKCGPNNTTNYNVRISRCMYETGKEIQIPTLEVDNFKYADFYFFEKDGLFLVLDIKKFESLSPFRKKLVVTKSKKFANTSFNVINLLEFDCIKDYGYCDGTNIFKNSNIEQSLLRVDSKGKLKTKYKMFPKLWMRGCKTTLKPPKYQAIYISDKNWEIIESSTLEGLVENFTDKNGNKLTRQTFTAQLKTNTENFLNFKVSQKLSISYCNKKPYLLIKAGFEEFKLKEYIHLINEAIETKQILRGLTEFLLEKSLKSSRIITKYNMTLDDFYEFIEKNNPSIFGLYKGNKIQILSGDNDSERDYYKYFKKIKGIE